MKNKDIVSVFVVTAAVLMVPFMAKPLNKAANWNLLDFTIMGTLLISTGLLIVFVLRKIKKINYRIAFIAGLMIILLLVWAELAVGIFGTPFSGS